MKRNAIIILIILILVASGLFYWYEYRPSKIRKNCNAEAQYSRTGSFEEFKAIQTYYEDKYKKCLRDNGLEK